MALERRALPADRELGRGELGGVRRLALLGHGLAEAGDAARQALDEQVASDGGEPGAQLPGGLVLADRHRGAGVDRPGVQPLLERHQADAGRRVAGQDGALDRRGASPAREQREVGVHHREPLQDLGTHEPAEGDDDAELGAAVDDVARALAHGDPALEREKLHRRGCWGATPPAAAVGAADHQHDLVARPDERAEDRGRDLRGAEEGEAGQRRSGGA